MFSSALVSIKSVSTVQTNVPFLRPTTTKFAMIEALIQRLSLRTATAAAAAAAVATAVATAEVASSSSGSSNNRGCALGIYFNDSAN